MLDQYVLLYRTGTCKASRSGRRNEHDKPGRTLVVVEARTQILYVVDIGQSHPGHIGDDVVSHTLAHEHDQSYGNNREDSG